ncbi:hypothetical protein P3T76_000581 [Phytophthora citrophthora]|uniref:Uncharacterized protein n=1 Tax=Phytophthora citrophthora TaxID=4793 RepID=A0AAD9LTP4_9STRA|nr:hypothetical protein P3T76_000581 [Phytophthora citrophthora]
MSEASSSSAQSRDPSSSPTWLSTQTMERSSRHKMVRTTEKSVVFRVRTQEKVSGSRGGRRSQQMLRLTQGEDTRGTDDRDVNEVLAELYAEVKAKHQWLHSEEETFERGQERLKSLKRQHAELLRTMNQCKRRRKERLNIQEMLRGDEDNDEDYERKSSMDSGSDSDYSSYRSRHHRSRHEKAKKERKRLRRFQSKVSLQFQLLQSECQRSKLEVEKALAEVRSKYADSYLFGNSFTF